jgi:6-phospho-3-hexuloisomerase
MRWALEHGSRDLQQRSVDYNHRPAAVTVTQSAQASLDELQSIVDTLDETQLDTVAHILANTPRIFFTGTGRSGLAARAIAMRLMHIGKPCYVVSEVATPAIQPGDILVAFTSSGRGSVLEQAKITLEHGAGVIAFTSGENEITALSEAFIAIPARTIVPTEQYAGSLFEQGCLIVGDAICRSVQSLLKVPTSQLNARHANIL